MRRAPLLALLLLTACGRTDPQRQAASDDQLLNDSAAMLDENSLAANAATANESDP